MVAITPLETPEQAIAAWALDALRRVVAIDSQSDERSATIPSTEGQRTLADHVAGRFTELGATITRDDHANVIAHLPGRGAGASAPPLALMVHLDTARGTMAADDLAITPGWDGRPIRYAAQPDLRVDADTYPAAAAFVGHDLVHGDGLAPFGLDDKLGLTHMLTMAHLLAEHPAIDHPPLYLIGRPDEEIGRMAAVEGLADWLAERDVRSGYTVDGVWPFEVNVENFNAAAAAVRLPARPLEVPGDARVGVFVGGVNTHGCTAKAEGYRAAARLLSEVVARLGEGDGADLVAPIWLAADAVRDCDARAVFAVAGEAGRRALGEALDAVVAPHTPRGASYRVLEDDELDAVVALASASGPTDAALEALRFVGATLSDDPGFVVPAEDSDGRQGYSSPYRATATGSGATIDVRLRDFEADGLAARKAHVREVAEGFAGADVDVADQYVNMGPRMVDRRELVDWAQAAADAIGVEAPELPIRGGTGVDPFLDRGVAIANIGTGYFAPESEKEFTSTQMMALHARWLVALVERVAHER